MDDVGIFYGRLVNFTAIMYVLWIFVVFWDNLVYVSRFGMSYQKKSGNPGTDCGTENSFRRRP
jgi:hypothetical protein